MKLTNIIICLLILYIFSNKTNSNLIETMKNKLNISNDLNKFVKDKFKYPKTNNNYYNKIEKTHHDLDNYFKVEKQNYNTNNNYSKPTLSESINNRFDTFFESNITNNKDLIEPEIDNFSNNLYYTKLYEQGKKVYPIDNWMYKEEAVNNGGNFFNNIHGYDNNINYYYY